MNGQWLSILEYANISGKSISTIRRYLKSRKLESKLIEGRYLIWKEGASTEKKLANTPSDIIINKKLEDIEKTLRAKDEEICELKMLVSLYESKMKKNNEPPALPMR